ncbi:hypothetical protein [Halapricum desulfuricans]|uniref:Putative membrane protein n=1 Tax=Halapricum desulfuricans TaxID=2841257 RepID=A0A897N2W8_9EURY|nr:hypothetical protein [Halapricum desulfuricans]QSG08750.1 putative membrane protein [Halapricum desulfuricans]QSG11692.1 putative membrane protein [Halapricum desulfuricans]
MATSVPLQLVDSFLLKYNVGDALLLVFGLAVVAALVVRSRKVLALQSGLFGIIFVVTPSSELVAAEQSLLSEPLAYKFFGLVLVFAAPLLYATARK